ncbi:MAG TPA: Hpt domain-containing protein [Accumulibacter sp.]|uniref:Hpt domain-containing protein n=1 Tax=Accumulibacter sp. TaxID=2053492 RepID=UPI0025E1D259|nr:hybrid sensor histidine kinase/response regulator [Accumulibacter sp.]MCM8598695.1 Hpt domain-containing protein [Accumulibacter sp.]MCM8662813.1 Hpt domain-containing protein [Accumulibacter sp.]HNC50898.1 Hpt domain-containing protein [Accumulibacter sp.]
MDDYLSKPFVTDCLSAVLPRWLPHAGTAEASWPLHSPRSDSTIAEQPLDRRALDAIRELPDGSGVLLLRKLIRAFLGDAPRRLAAMRAAVDAGDAGGLRDGAHRMKSSSATVGADRLAALCSELELLARSGSVEGAGALLTKTEAELPRVLVALRQQRQRQGRRSPSR